MKGHASGVVQAQRIIEEVGPHKPELVVFDLDYTLWPYWCEMYSPRDTQMAQLFPDTQSVIDACKAAGIKMAVASRSPTPATAESFLKALGLSTGYFERKVIVPGTNKDLYHFPQLQKALGIEYKDMLFFDDEGLQISRVGMLGVTATLVSTSDGVSLRAFDRGMKAHAKKKNHS